MERDRRFLEWVNLLEEFRNNSVWERLQRENPEIYNVFDEFFSSITEKKHSAVVFATQQAQERQEQPKSYTLALERRRQEYEKRLQIEQERKIEQGREDERIRF